MSSRIGSPRLETYTHFYYLALQPNIFSEIIDRVIQANLFATKTEDGKTVRDLKFSLETIDLSGLLGAQNVINNLHCRDGKIYCRDTQNIFILNPSVEDDIKTIPIGKVNAVHIQNAKACIIRPEGIEVIDLNTGQIVSTLQNPSSYWISATTSHGSIVYNNFDIQITDSHLSIGYIGLIPGSYHLSSDRSRSFIIWDYKTRTRLDQIEPFEAPGKESLNEVKHLTNDTLYSVIGLSGEERIQKWDLNNPENTSLSDLLKKKFYNLIAYKEYLFACNDSYLSVYKASNLDFFHCTERFIERSIARNPLPFGNSILCNLGTDIGAMKIDGDIFANSVEIVLEGNKMSALKSQICCFDKLGIGKLALGTLDGKIHILDFLG